MMVNTLKCPQGRPLRVMDVCCGLGTVSLAGQALSEAVRETRPGDRRGFEVD